MRKERKQGKGQKNKALNKRIVTMEKETKLGERGQTERAGS